MKIVIIGGGNVGTQFTVHCSEKGHEVFLFTSHAEDFTNPLVIENENGAVIHKSGAYTVTHSPDIAFTNFELMFVTVPAFCMKEIAETILPYVNHDAKICLVPGTGGGEWAFKNCVKKGAILFGLQRVPSVSRIIERGKSVRAIGYREKIHVAALSSSKSKGCADLISCLFDMQCESLPNYLAVALTPSNPILHTSRLYCLFKDYSKSSRYDTVPLFYEEWTDECSELLLQMDDEVQGVCKCFPVVDLSGVKSLRVHYEINSATELTDKIKNIKGFKGLKTPMTSVEGGYVPDFSSRYFSADFDYGLSIFVQICGFVKCKCGAMKKVLDWYESLHKSSSKFSFQDFSCHSKDDFINYYLKDGAARSGK